MGAPGITRDGRVIIQAVTPQVEGGRYAAKAVVGDDVVVAADIFREGHDKLAAVIRYRGPTDRSWRESPLELDVNDRWYGAFHVDAMGAWRYTVCAWTDHYASWLDGLRKKHEAGQEDLELELADGRALLERRRFPRAALPVVERALERLSGGASNEERVAAAADPERAEVLRAHPERLDASTLRPDLPLWVDRERARFSAWYEMFPRSEGAVVPTDEDPSATEARSGTFADAQKRLPAIAEMGFDVVYLPPIHPIGRTNRKGRRGPHDLQPGPDDPGVPWAIGSE